MGLLSIEMMNNQFTKVGVEKVNNPFDVMNSGNVLMSDNPLGNSKFSHRIWDNSAIADLQIINQNWVNQRKTIRIDRKFNEEKSVSQNVMHSSDLYHSHLDYQILGIRTGNE